MAPRNDDVSRTLHLNDLVSEQLPGTPRYVNPGNAGANDANDGLSWDTCLKTLQAAVNAASPLDRILAAPAAYAETLTVPIAKTNLTLIGVGPRQQAAIAPTAANKDALIVNADDFAIYNFDLAATGTGIAAKNTGRRLHAKLCKFENDDTGVGSAGLRLDVSKVADNHVLGQNGSDVIIEDCEFAWAANGVILRGSDFGALTEARFKRCWFHNIPTAHFEEGNNAGDAQHQFASLEISDCLFEQDEAGADPSAYILLNDDNANKGIVSGCTFPTALNGGKNLVSTGLKWVRNWHPAGVSTGQPS